MRQAVCVKPVPDPGQWHKLRLDQGSLTLVRDGVGVVMNPLDRHALEGALQLREVWGGEVVVVAMAPPEGAGVLREALAMGADRAVLVSDRRLAGSDTLGTAHALARAVATVGDCQMVWCGDESIDGGTAQVSAQVAEYLGWANLMHVARVEPRADGGLLVDSLVEQGWLEVAVRPPVVLSVVARLNIPRYVTMLGILQAEAKPLETWGADELCLEEACVGLLDSPTQMAGMCPAPAGGKALMLEGGPQEQARELADRLRRLGFC